jgi:hypothetical protein
MSVANHQLEAEMQMCGEPGADSEVLTPHTNVRNISEDMSVAISKDKEF